MKTELQLQRFLGSHDFKSETDWKMISVFCSSELKYHLDIEPQFSFGGITASDFSKWLDHGYGCGDVAKLNGELVIIGRCNLEYANVEGTLEGESINLRRSRVLVSKLSPASEEEKALFKRTLSKNNLQFGELNLLLIEKFIPQPTCRVVFYNEQLRGLGVVRDIDLESGEIVLYCYFIYNTGKIGYSMYETGICSLHEFSFEPMTPSQVRRMNNELKEFGKVWYEKLHRIEPVQVKVKKGGKYYYINDKMKMICETEKGTPTSQMRYQAGNYFKDADECLECLGEFNEVLRRSLAK